MGKLFKAQTAEGYTIKVLADLLQNNIKTACLLVDTDGIRLTMHESISLLSHFPEMETTGHDFTT